MVSEAWDVPSLEEWRLKMESKVVCDGQSGEMGGPDVGFEDIRRTNSI